MTKEELEKEAEEYAGTVHRYRDAQGETEQMEDVAEAWEKGYECCAKELEYAKTIIQDLLDNSDEYARQRAINFLRWQNVSDI